MSANGVIFAIALLGPFPVSAVISIIPVSGIGRLGGSGIGWRPPARDTGEPRVAPEMGRIYAAIH